MCNWTGQIAPQSHERRARRQRLSQCQRPLGGRGSSAAATPMAGRLERSRLHDGILSKQGKQMIHTPLCLLRPHMALSEAGASRAVPGWRGPVDEASGRRCGAGTYVYPNAFYRYEGDYSADGKKNGGARRLASSSNRPRARSPATRRTIYTAGHGRLVMGDGWSYYKGDWVDDEMQARCETRRCLHALRCVRQRHNAHTHLQHRTHVGLAQPILQGKGVRVYPSGAKYTGAAARSAQQRGRPPRKHRAKAQVRQPSAALRAPPP